jgi:nucleoside-diphosphate-sugar epimerase
MNESSLHLVLGAGQVGPFIAEELVSRGARVRVGRRTAVPSRAAGVENVVLDVRDAASVARAAEGASVVYHCVNPLYHQWPEMLLPMTRGIVDGVARAGAKLVVLDNLYMYGKAPRMSETTPMAPVSKKGALRVEAAAYMLEADAKGKLPVAIGRAPDFFGPEARLSILGDYFFDRILKGKDALLFGDPDALHAYAYTPDVARGLVALGTSDARGLWMLPVHPAESTRQVVARFGRALGRDIGVRRLPAWVLRAGGLFDPQIGEAAEMTYQWRQPFVVDDARFRAAFGFGPTPWDEAIGRTLAWAREAYGNHVNSAARRDHEGGTKRTGAARAAV